MISDIKHVHRTGQVKITVSIERTSELARMSVKIRLDFKSNTERVTGFSLFSDELPTKSLLKLLRTAVS